MCWAKVFRGVRQGLIKERHKYIKGNPSFTLGNIPSNGEQLTAIVYMTHCVELRHHIMAVLSGLNISRMTARMNGNIAAVFPRC